MSWRLPRCGASGASPCSPAGSVSAEPRSRCPAVRVSLVAALASLLGGVSPLAVPPALLLGSLSLLAFTAAPPPAGAHTFQTPSNVTVSGQNESLVVSFDKPGFTNSFFWGTNVQYRVKQPQGQWQAGGYIAGVVCNVNTGTTGCSATITGLVNGTTYEVRVGFRTGENHDHYATAVEGTPAAPTSTSTPAAPTNLSVSRSSGGLQLSWTAPSGTLTGYDIHYTSAASGTVANDATATGSDASAAWVADASGASASDTSEYVSDLTDGVTYRLRLRAKNASGNGAWAFTTGTPNIGLKLGRQYLCGC